ncbi:MAG: hypothetical protein AAB254_06450 [candidate division NC10 bacterium]
MQPPTLQDVYRARQVISRHLAPTPLVRSAATWAEGLMTRVPFDLTFAIIREHIDEIVLVSEEEMRRLKDRLRGQTVVLFVSGCNITLDQLRRVLADAPAW